MKARKIIKTILIMALLGGHSWAGDSKYSKDAATTEGARKRHVVQRDQTVSRLTESTILNLRQMKLFHPAMDYNKALLYLTSGQQWAGENKTYRKMASSDAAQSQAYDSKAADRTSEVASAAAMRSNDITSIVAARNRYIAQLNHSVIGISESAMFNLIQMKMFYPELDYSKAVRSLNRQMKKRNNRAFQCKAFLAISYLKHPDWFNWFPELDRNTSGEFLQRLSEEIDNQVMSMGKIGA